jgi:hypothetical protein
MANRTSPIVQRHKRLLTPPSLGTGPYTPGFQARLPRACRRDTSGNRIVKFPTLLT